MVNYSTLPHHMQDGARLYVEQGIPPGSFLNAVLSNDLKGSFACADRMNQNSMFEWASWLFNECPSIAQGSQETVAKWIELGGMVGLEKARQQDEARNVRVEQAKK